MNKGLHYILVALLAVSCSGKTVMPYGNTVTLSEDVLADKIRGGWFA